MTALTDPKTFNHKKVLCVFQPLQVHPRWETLIAGAPMHKLTFSTLPASKKALLWKSKVTYSRANPRDLNYMLNALRDVTSQMNHPPVMDVFLPGAADNDSAQKFFRRQWDARALNQLRQEQYDAVIFLYPDAIGFSWNKTEKMVDGLGIPNHYILNGRRRFFKRDGMRGKLSWRRFLERTWIVEFALAAAFTFISVPLAIYDSFAKGSK